MSNTPYVGQLDTRISFCKIDNPTVSETGERTEGETLLKTVWGNVEHQNSTETMEGQPVLLNVKKVTVRYYEELNVKGIYMMIDDVSYEIVGVEKIDRKRYLKYTITDRE